MSTSDSILIYHKRCQNFALKMGLRNKQTTGEKKLFARSHSKGKRA